MVATAISKKDLAAKIIHHKHKRQPSNDMTSVGAGSTGNKSDNKQQTDMLLLQEMQIDPNKFETVSLEDTLIQERERATKHVQKEMIGIHQVFNDMALLVKEQGETVDNIESSIENAKVHAHRGVEQLQQAEQKKDWARTVTATVATVGTTAAAVALIVLL
eukprot:TRINITY_DN12939_c0_g1_i1.p1 TRINITY_DN12939_c0_g1~~TRINITY_DN12939_c0_g1_i1.p1  ORF type:complete len:161 (+),score=46.61 TRINITY_DN12939_c0_g1_i1:140-622(+)